MPLDTRATRDEEHKQAITEYESSVIEPKLVEFVRSQAAMEGKEITFSFESYGEDDMGLTGEGGIFYTIGHNALSRLGNNKSYILKVIGDLYNAEGYKIETGFKFGGHPAIQVIQPSTDM